MCDQYVVETVFHMLFVCPELAAIRETYWTRLADVAPPALLQSISDMNLCERQTFLLSGLRSPYIREWQTIYEAIAAFVCTLYTTRCRLMGIA